MSKNTSFALSEPYKEFIHDQVSSGRFGSASEVVREGLRLLQQREMKIEALRKAIQEGIDSGPAEAWDEEALLDSIKARAKELGRV